MSTTVSSSERSEMKPASKARRCLFGPVDHDIVRRDLSSMIVEDMPAQNTWNYDFIKDTPSKGDRFEWNEVDPTKEYVPEFYRKGYTTRQPPTPRKVNIPRTTQINSTVTVKKPTAVRQLDSLFRDSEESDITDNTRSSMLSSSVSSLAFSSNQLPSTPTRTPSRSRRSTRNEVGTPLQSRISDFMNIRKRRNENESTSSSQRKLPRL